MPYQDVRDFLDTLARDSELAHVRAPVDLTVELGAVCRKTLDEHGPALWFDQPNGISHPVVTGTLATRKRIALALETSVDTLQETWLERGQQSLDSVTCSAGSAPCKDVSYIGDRVNLLETLPVPKWNELDGGPVITLACCFSADPETGQRNVGIYRLQVHDENTIGLQGPPYRHVFLHAKPSLEAGKPFPVAFAIGLDPTIVLAAAAGLPAGSDELSLAASLRGAPIAVVDCETLSLQVPAAAEFILEGELLPDVMIEEGPFGDVTGYYSLRRPQPVVRVKAITHRTDPIHVAAYTGRPPSENATVVAIQNEGELLRAVPLPGIKKIHVTEGGSGGFNCVVSVKKAFEGYGKMVGMAIMGTWAGRPVKNLIIVDDDVDPFDWNQVEWAMATRFQPDRDLEIIKAVTGHGLDPSIPEEERKKGTALTSKMIIDATRYGAAHYEIGCQPSPSVMKKIEDQWERYGIPLS